MTQKAATPTVVKLLMRAAWSTALCLVPATAPAQAPRPQPTVPTHGPRTLPRCTSVGQQVTLSLNTGLSVSVPAADPIWVVTPASSATITPWTTTPVSAWLPNSSASKWIQPSTSGTPVNFPVKAYVYRTQFRTPVDPYLYNSITITGRFAADDTAVVKLNSIPIANCAGGSSVSMYCFANWTAIPGAGLSTFNRASGFLNTLEIEVKNTLGNSPSGLQVQAQVVATCSKCTSPIPPVSPPCGGNPSTC